jgi:nitrile hydratase subunit beta
MKYATGDDVRIAARAHAGHHRTPAYVKGRAGRIERCHGAFTNPETRAYGNDGLPAQPLYLVSLSSETTDRVLVDVFEHWLEAP